MTTTQAHRRRRLVGVVVAAVSLLGLSTGSAAQLGVGATAVGSGVAVVGDCQGSTAVRVQLLSGWVTNQFTTTGVRVYGVVGGCEGQRLRVTLVDGLGQALREVTVPSLPSTPPQFHELTLSPSIPTSSIAGARIVIHT